MIGMGLKSVKDGSAKIIQLEIIWPPPLQSVPVIRSHQRFNGENL